MMADDCGGESPFRNPQASGGSPVGLHLYLQDQFYGDRTGALKDPFGHIWFLATHKEELSPDEIKQRAETMFKQPDASPASQKGLSRHCIPPDLQ